MAENTDFGYESINCDDKRDRVNTIFSNVAPYYDIMNDLLSAGLHRYWKKTFLEYVKINPNDCVLDLACGSGDIFLGLAKKNARIQTLYGVDPNHEMLNQAKVRAAQAQIYTDQKTTSFKFIQAFGENLSFFANCSLDVVTLSFGLRNVAERKRCLKEIYRILKPGGRFYLMEFAKIQPSYAPFYKFYREVVMPTIGQTFFDDKSSYQYLADSIEVFWDQRQCKAILNDLGFSSVTTQNLSQGIVCIYQSHIPEIMEFRNV